MNAAQKLTKRAMKKEREIVAAFANTAALAGMTPDQLAASTVMIYADVRAKPARVAAFNMNPSPEVRSSGGPRLITTADRARVVTFMRDGGPKTKQTETLAAMFQSPPQEGFFWLLCVAGAPGERMISWSVSMIAWSAYGAAIENGEMLRGDAVAVWHEMEREQPGVWEKFPRKTTGPITDDERVRMVRSAWAHERRGGAGAN